MSVCLQLAVHWCPESFLRTTNSSFIGLCMDQFFLFVPLCFVMQFSLDPSTNGTPVLVTSPVLYCLLP